MKRIKIKEELKKLIVYGIITLLITIVDMVVARMTFQGTKHLIFSNTLGIITGSVLQYILTLRYAFRITHSPKILLVHVATYVVGLAIANGVITISYQSLLEVLSEKTAFFGAKGISIVSTFFMTYAFRRYFFQRLGK